MSQTWNGTKKETPERRTYTVDDIAQILGIIRISAYILIKEEHFKIVRIGNAIRIFKRSFDEWLRPMIQERKNDMESIIKRKKLFRCLQLCGRKRRNQTEVGNLAYPQRGLEAQGGNRKSAAHWNFSPAKQSDDHCVPLWLCISLRRKEKGCVYV